MKRITRDHTVPLEKRYKVREPVAEVELGETFIVETITFDTSIIRKPEDVNQFHMREETGPIFVKGIEPSDVLAIYIQAIEPVGHATGSPQRDQKTHSFLEISDGRVHFPGRLWSPLRTMIGDIYVTPPAWPGGNPWDNGGNMDFKDIAPGNALHLRAQLEGGLLVLGDAHAVQGDGLILGLAAECAADVTLRITKDETFLSDRPLIKKPDSFVTIASRPDYVKATELAAEDAAKVLTRLTGCSENEAFLYVATVGDLRAGSVFTMGLTNVLEMGRRIPLTVGIEVPLLGIEDLHA